MRRLRLLWVLGVLLLLPLAAGAQERILLFSSHAAVREDSSLLVREDIRVNVEGQQIRRGIYRDFPTIYRSASGGSVRVGFSVKGALLDGKKVPYKTESLSNGVRVYLGDPDGMAPRGEHTYTLEYLTTGQVGFFDRHDELYWNVTGNGWDFAIERAQFSLSLPGEAPFTSVEFYTGYQGEKGQRARILPGDVVETTASLAPRQGLTVVYTWPKGIVTPPPIPWRVRFVEKYAFLLLLGAPLALLLVYTLLWLRWGKDPPMPGVIPLFAPPGGKSPGFLRYIRRMGMDKSCFAAEILNLAVKGHLVIREMTPEEFLEYQGVGSGLLGGLASLSARFLGKTYLLQKRQAPASPSWEDQALLGALFPSGKNDLLLRQENHEILEKAREKLEKRYRDNGKDLFSKNTLLWILGLLVPIPFWLLIAWGQKEDLAVLAVVLSVAFTLVGFLLFKSLLRLKGEESFFKKLFKSVLPALLGFLFLGGLFLVFDAELLMVPFTSLLVAAGAVLFRELMTIRSPKGNEVLAEAEGLVMYMHTAERHRLERFNPPEETPEVFEALLPYAFALDVVHTWANRFEKVLAERGYEPTWYQGANLAAFYTGSGITSVTSAVSSSIASASTAPGSSSGSGGGGSSGGGGGGGGGGGW